MICPSSIDSTPRTSPETFTNWARALSFTASAGFQPTNRGEIVEIIRQAESRSQRVKWTGSIWSFMGNYIAPDFLIQSDGITGVIDSSLILDNLTLADPAIRKRLVHIKGGTKVFNVNRLLHGMQPASTGDGPDEQDLECKFNGRDGKALPTLGGSGGQAIAGVMATGSHGGDIFLPPIADAVEAIHLIGPGGQEWWIERSRGLTAGTEADTQNELQNITTSNPAAAEMCSGILVKKDDDFFRSVLVSVGRIGFVYSLVIKSVPAFKLTETRANDTWETFKNNLTAGNLPGFVKGLHFLQVIVNPFGNGTHECKVAKRVKVECKTPNVVVPGRTGFDFQSFLCSKQNVQVIIPLLVAALATILATIAGLVVLKGIEFATATALAAIPFIGWALAVAMYAVWAVTIAAIAALTVTATALTALIVYMTAAGSMTAGDLIAALANFA